MHRTTEKPMAQKKDFSDHDITDPFPFNGFGPSQRGLADAFMKGPDGDGKNVPDMRYIPGFGWRIYDGELGIWLERSTEYVQGMMAEFADGLQKKANQLDEDKAAAHTDTKKSHLSEENYAVLRFLNGAARQTSTIEKAVQALSAANTYKYGTKTEDFDKDPAIIVCKNRTLYIDPKTGAIEPLLHNPKYMATRRIPVRWVKSAQCPRWKKGLERMYINPVTREPDRDTIRYIQKLFGYALTASREMDLIVFFDGAGANGKSQFMEAVLGLFGGDDCGMATETDADILLASKDHTAFRRALADLAGTRIALADEMDTKAVVKEHMYKKVTVKTQRVEQKWKADYKVRLSFTLFIFVNDVPTFKDFSHGMARRLVIIPHFAQMKREGAQEGAYTSEVVHSAEETIDNYGAWILNQEAEGLLAWFINGIIAYRKEGLVPSEAIDRRTKQALEIAKALTPIEFRDTMLVTSPDNAVPRADVYEAYKRWLASEGSNYPLSPTNFAKELRKMGIESGRRRIDGSKNPQYCFLGVELDKTVQEENTRAARVRTMNEKLAQAN